MKNNFYINTLLKVSTNNGVRSFIYVKDIVCENNKNETSELISNTKYPLFESIENIPHNIKEGYIVLKGLNALDFRNYKAKSDDEILLNFYSFFEKSLIRLEKKDLNKLDLIKNIYQMLKYKNDYLLKKYSHIQYILD